MFTFTSAATYVFDRPLRLPGCETRKRWMYMWPQQNEKKNRDYSNKILQSNSSPSDALKIEMRSVNVKEHKEQRWDSRDLK
jgi:hypothetical protein